MKIRLLSDLHAEYGINKELFVNPSNVDVLVLAGDIHVGADNVWTMLKQFAEYHPHVVYLPGNHEYYRHNIKEFDAKITKWSKGTNIHFLNPGSIKIEDITFICGALWTNFRNNMFSAMAAARGINDFRLIQGFSTNQASSLYIEHLAYIKEAYSKIEGTKVICTHFLPAIECISEQFKGDNILNDYFASDNGEWISTLKNVPYFLFGHTHDNVDLMIGDTKVIANPYGYVKNLNYKECIIEV